MGDKEMDRKDFLKYSGLVLVSAIGLKGIVSLVSQVDKEQIRPEIANQKPRSFGSGKYGG